LARTGPVPSCRSSLLLTDPPCTAQQLARGLGWTLTRTVDALQRLEESLADTGQILTRTAKVFDMLLALPRHGRVKVTKIMHGCRVSPSTTFGP
jgi:hypothetical protein